MIFISCIISCKPYNPDCKMYSVYNLKNGTKIDEVCKCGYIKGFADEGLYYKALRECSKEEKKNR